MIRCANNTRTVPYDVTGTMKEWECPSDTTGHYFYLFAEDDTKDPCLTEVFVFGTNIKSAPMNGGKYVTDLVIVTGLDSQPFKCWVVLRKHKIYICILYHASTQMTGQLNPPTLKIGAGLSIPGVADNLAARGATASTVMALPQLFWSSRVSPPEELKMITLTSVAFTIPLQVIDSHILSHPFKVYVWNICMFAYIRMNGCLCTNLSVGIANLLHIQMFDEESNHIVLLLHIHHQLLKWLIMVTWSIPIITWLHNFVSNIFTTIYVQNHHFR